MLTRRHFTITAAALFSQPIASTMASARPTSDKSNWDAWFDWRACELRVRAHGNGTYQRAL